ncbi:uncharacterized protein LOC135383502 [Ornithodoros turicata]|uniref:uncharacterized protein LOC135383502 n=1 Tax=Ornithodoros turicata TaxID=34597 RepID=UPI003138C19D
MRKLKRMNRIILATTFIIMVVHYIPAALWYAVYGGNPFNRVTSSQYRIRTKGCNVREFDPFHPTVGKFIQKVQEPRCPGKADFITTYDELPHIDTEALSAHGVSVTELRCFYREIFANYSMPVPDKNYYYGPTMPLQFGRPLKKEFLHVHCSTTNSTQVFHEQFLFNPIMKQDVEDRCRDAPRARDHHNLSVIFLGIDSISYLNFKRHLPLTGSFIRKHIDAFELHGYNKVGDNTFPNLMAMVAGMSVAEIEAITEDGFFDGVKLFWIPYARRGYRTSFQDEFGYYGMFHYCFKGFRNPPTDYYIHPVSLLLREHLENVSQYHDEGVPCIRQTLSTEYYLDYLTRLLKHTKVGLFFYILYLGTMTHDYVNNAGYMDALLRRFFGKIEQVLNRTVLVFFSDHGIRYGNIRTTFIGRYEDRQPFAFLVFPRWFLNANPAVLNALEANQKRLTTPYDIHATFVEFLNFPRTAESKTKRGLSLLHEIPENRTCDDASIPREWCSCEAADQDISMSDPLVMAMGRNVVKKINAWLEKHWRLCFPLTLDYVLDIATGYSSEEERQQNITHYWVTVQTRPSAAIFEATVRANHSSGDVNVVGDISRCNKYGDQSYCIKDRWLEKFCVCRLKQGRKRHFLVNLYRHTFG